MDRFVKDRADYKASLGGRPDNTNKEKDLEDIIEELVDKLNGVIDLGNIVEGYSFSYAAAKGRTKAKLTITHSSSGDRFVISAQ